MMKKPPLAADIPITEQLLYTTARITSSFSGGQEANGTGFFYKLSDNGTNHVPCIITNRHVVQHAEKIDITMRIVGNDLNYISEKPHHLEIVSPQGIIKYHPDPDVDLAAILIGQIINQGVAKGIQPYFFPMSCKNIPSEAEESEFMVADGVIMVGYPNGLWDKHNNMPLLRKGSISTLPHLDYNGKQVFVVDMACLQGSSGSPVYYYDNALHTHNGNSIKFVPRVKLLGVLYAGPEYEIQGEFNDMGQTLTAPVLNLGYVIKAKRISDIEAIVRLTDSQETR